VTDILIILIVVGGGGGQGNNKNSYCIYKVYIYIYIKLFSIYKVIIVRAGATAATGQTHAHNTHCTRTGINTIIVCTCVAV
jgi:hypothetical protein